MIARASALVLASLSPALALRAVAVRRDPVIVGRLHPVAARRPGPAGARRLFAAVGSRRAFASLARRVEARSPSSAPDPDRPAAIEVVGAKVTLAVAGALLGVCSPVPLVAPALALAGFRAPEIWLARTEAARRRSAARELPVFLDLLSAAVSAGLTGQLAVREAVAIAEGPLADAFGRAIHAVDLGGRWREEMVRVAESLGLPDLRRAVVALARSDALGSSLSEHLEGIASDAREARRAREVERARTAPVKMLFPLVFLVLPAFLLLTVVPVLLTTVRTIR